MRSAEPRPGKPKLTPSSRSAPTRGKGRGRVRVRGRGRVYPNSRARAAARLVSHPPAARRHLVRARVRA